MSRAFQQGGTGRIWLIGGTQESVAIATVLSKAEAPFVVTVTTEAAREMYAIAQAEVYVGSIAPEAMSTWLCTQRISGILDASHPFATVVSRGAIAAAESAQRPYLRFERPGVRLPESKDAVNAKQVHLVPDLETLLTAKHLMGQRVLLVLGYRLLHHFAPWQSHSSLFARILPSQMALAAAFEAGFTSDRLIALRPPVSVELERSLWQQWEITKVVAKCSGQAGGELTKRAVAMELEVPLWLIQRPSVNYPQQTHSVAVALEFARQALLSSR